MENKYPIIIAGGRDFNDIRLALSSLKEFCKERNLKPSDIEIVSGTARGADSLGEFIATRKNISLIQFKPEWETYGNMAGFKRNEEMANYTSTNKGGCIVFWNGSSKGSLDMIKRAKDYNLDLKVVMY